MQPIRHAETFKTSVFPMLLQSIRKIFSNILHYLASTHQKGTVSNFFYSCKHRKVLPKMFRSLADHCIYMYIMLYSVPAKHQKSILKDALIFAVTNEAGFYPRGRLLYSGPAKHQKYVCFFKDSSFFDCSSSENVRKTAWSYICIISERYFQRSFVL